MKAYSRPFNRPYGQLSAFSEFMFSHNTNVNLLTEIYIYEIRQYINSIILNKKATEYFFFIDLLLIERACLHCIFFFFLLPHDLFVV